MVAKERIPVIGITGGAGSGKSHVAGLLTENYKVCHINTDRVSQMQMMKGGCVYQKVLDCFGTEFLRDDGEINRKRLGEYIFNHPDELALLNSITHPPVRAEVERLMQEAGENGYDVVLLESALLIEAGYKGICDEVWYVYATRKTRKKRLLETRGYSEERIRDMFRRQNTDKFFREHADFVIQNDNCNDETILSSLSRRLLFVMKRKNG